MLSSINKVNLKFEVNVNKKYILVLVALTIVLSACTTTAGERGPAGEQGPAGEVSQEEIEAAVNAALTEEEAEVSGTLVIYSGRKESLVSEIIAEFESTSGVTVEVLSLIHI